ncbi:MAG: hypothetical protein Fur0042_01250 [Cyanophyceae cyanobacterium]
MVRRGPRGQSPALQGLDRWVGTAGSWAAGPWAGDWGSRIRACHLTNSFSNKMNTMIKKINVLRVPLGGSEGAEAIAGLALGKRGGTAGRSRRGETGWPHGSPLDRRVKRGIWDQAIAGSSPPRI